MPLQITPWVAGLMVRESCEPRLIPEFVQLPAFLDEVVDAQAEDTRHGSDRIRPALAVDHKQRRDQVLDSQHRFDHQGAAARLAPQPARTMRQFKLGGLGHGVDWCSPLNR